jgi:hypothetical protein
MPRCFNCNEKFTATTFLQKSCTNLVCQGKFRELQKSKLKVVNKKPINKVSPKREALKKDYETVRIEVLSEAKFKCFIKNCNKTATTIEHLMGHKGFADQWARDNNIPLHIDKRYLRACCLPHNGELETNPILAKEYQYSKISGIKKSEL